MCLNPQRVKMQYVACGKCIECKIAKSNEWAFRICLEAQQYASNCFLTLTYNEENLPKDNSLNRRDVQLFLKRLRKALAPKKIRYFGSGEYGSRKGRPHFHIIIFDYCPEDLYFFKYDNKKTKLYRSPFIEKLWTLGFSSIGEINFDTAKYCAKYLQKDIGNGKNKPFVFMSLKPGIGFNAIKPKLIDSDKIYLNGKYIKLPKYFLDTLDKQGFDLTTLRKNRLSRGFSGDQLWEQIEEVKKRQKKFTKIFEKSLDKDFNV